MGLALQEIVLEGRKSSDRLLVATRIDAVKRSPKSADTAVCVRGEVSLSDRTLPHIFLQLLCLHLPTTFLTSLSTSSYKFPHIFLQLSSPLCPHLPTNTLRTFLQLSPPLSPHLPTTTLSTSSYNFPHLSLHIFLQILSALSYNFLHLSVYIFLQLSPSSAHGRHTLNYIYEL